MQIEPLDTIISELSSDNWLKAGSAIRKLIPHGQNAVSALPALLGLTLHDKAPLVSDSMAFIKRLGSHAVPFLRDQAAGNSPRHRAMAIELLTEAGFRPPSTTRLIEQKLDNRRDDLPEWGVEPDEIFDLFKASLGDQALEVRFAAASALEEFGQHVSGTIPVFIEALQLGTLSQMNWAALRLGRIGPPAMAASQALAAAAHKCRYAALAASNALSRIREA